MMNEEVRERLRSRLNEVHQWPSVYMFKFILEPQEERLQRVLALFPPESEVLRRYSTAGRYLSLTVKEVMMNADDVLARYDKAYAIPGVIVM